MPHLRLQLQRLRLHCPELNVPFLQLRTREASCQLRNNGTHYVIKFAYDECGTSVSYFTDVMIVHNDITVHSILSGDGIVVFNPDYTIPVECSQPRHQHVTNSFQPVSREPVTEIGHQELAQSDIRLKEFRTERFVEEITKYPVQVPLNRELFFEVSISDDLSHHSLGFRVTECKATPTYDPNQSGFRLIQDGCPVTRAVHVIPAQSRDVFRFKVQSFKFSGHSQSDDEVYIHCDVTLCHVNCDVSCPSTTRRRRSGRMNRQVSNGGRWLTSGPLLVHI